MSKCCDNHHNHEEKDACTIIHQHYGCCHHNGGIIGESKSHGIEKWDEPGTYEWAVPEGVTEIFVSAAGAGAGGSGSGRLSASASDLVTGAGGGGGASIIREKFQVVPGDVLALAIGSGGTGGACNSSGYGQNGDSGGPTSVGNLITLPGGNPPRLNAVGGDSGPVRGGFSGGDGGQNGGCCIRNNSMSSYNHIKGGDTLIGFGGTPTGDTLKSISGKYGGGGSGGNLTITSTHGEYAASGGNGGDGVVIIEW